LTHLYKLIKDSETKWVKSDELELFRILVRNGNYYQYLIDSLNLEGKKEAKDLTYKVLFGKNHKNSRLDKYFENDSFGFSELLIPSCII
jgi:hypothetical protein